MFGCSSHVKTVQMLFSISLLTIRNIEQGSEAVQAPLFPSELRSPGLIDKQGIKSFLCKFRFRTLFFLSLHKTVPLRIHSDESALMHYAPLEGKSKGRSAFIRWPYPETFCYNR